MQTQNDGRNDFDFFIGSWKVQHRRLKELLKGSTEWDTFESTVTDRVIMRGSVEDLDWLARQLAVFSFEFVVREPEQLKTELHHLSVKLDNMAKHSNTV